MRERIDNNRATINGKKYVKINNIFYPYVEGFDGNDLGKCLGEINYDQCHNWVLENQQQYYYQQGDMLCPMSEEQIKIYKRLEEIKSKHYRINGKDYYDVNGVMIPQTDKIDLSLNYLNYEYPKKYVLTIPI